jgi:hypothetical protein
MEERGRTSPPARLLISGAGVLAAGLLLVAALPAVERSFIYFPMRELDARPEDFGLRSEELRLPTPDGTSLHGWWIRAEGKLALLYFHGNGGNISHRLERVKSLVEALGLDVFLVDYRGYGRSTGTPSEKGLYEDGETVHRAAVERGFAPGRVVLFGESLGCAVAIELALRRNCRALILETPFLSVPAMAKAVYPFLPRFLVRTRYDNEAKIASVAAPKLIVQAERDGIVPPSHAPRLMELAPEPKEFYSIRGATHNDTYLVGGDAYLEVWRRFLGALSQAPSP